MKNFLVIIIVLLVCFLSFVTLVKYDVINLSYENNANIKENNNVDDQEDNISKNKIECTNCSYFELDEVSLTNGDQTLIKENYKIGDKFLNLKIADLKSVSFTANRIEDSVQVLFSGKVNLSGEIKCESLYENIECNWKFIPNSSSLASLPYYTNDTRNISFAFTDSSIKNFYSKVVGETKICDIVIDNYLIFYYPSAVSNSADLISYNCK